MLHGYDDLFHDELIFCDLQKEIMDILFDVFRLRVPVWTESFTQALISVGRLRTLSFTSLPH